MTGCSNGRETASSTDKERTQEPVTLTFWHSMGGALNEPLDQLVKKFNDTHPNIQVNAQFQGTYDDAINKLKSSVKGNAGPDIMQVYEIGTRFMIDSGYAVPMQKLIDEDKFDVSSLEKNLLSYYTIDGKLYSMPFNSSVPILYYNKTAFKEAGLDPEKAPKTFDEVIEMSKALTKKNGDKVEQYGFSMATYGWFFEQFLVKQGAYYANKDNGRSDKATAVEFDQNGAGVKIAEMWKKVNDQESTLNLGRKTDDTKAAFIAGKIAMTIDSTAALRNIVNSVGDRFEVGLAYLPAVDPAKDGGVSIGGGSLWVMDKKDKERQKAAFEFIKFMAAPEQQAFLSEHTGYFAITKDAYEVDSMKKYLEQYPQYQVAIDQLHNSPETATGAVLGVFPEARQTIETNIESMLQGKATAEEAVENTAKSINQAIENYNKMNK
jgi:sn-glycerol 3-phosphate transport system substrate-binding protein